VYLGYPGKELTDVVYIHIPGQDHIVSCSIDKLHKHPRVPTGDSVLANKLILCTHSLNGLQALNYSIPYPGMIAYYPCEQNEDRTGFYIAKNLHP